VLIVLEQWIAQQKGLEVNRGMDVISSLSSGMTNTLKNLMGLSVVLISYGWLVDHVALTQVTPSWWVYALAFLGMDFVGYWSHRFDHKINVFWNRHIVHHSSEEFNLSCALRQSISAVVGIYFFLYVPMALIGIPQEVVAIVAPLHLFAQFWYHTRVIDKMGVLEYILVTPSHHRVHHAINPRYLDKNLSQVFIFWDKLFGTFQEELPEDPPVYGVIKPVSTWNPIWINYMHAWALAKDAWRAHSWWDKVRLWWMPTGWRPSDVAEKYPWIFTEDPKNQIKYETALSRPEKVWAWTQLVIHFGLVFHLLIAFAQFEYTQVISYGIFLMVSIMGYTVFMDKSRWAPYAEALKFGLGLALLWGYPTWFGLDLMIPYASSAIMAYLLLSLALAFYFRRKD
ncbi:MAG TPA: sterol desaturase, partial [Flavobacteriaceae bacterium]|nr:sterol desaturase [Flavobacteriaceae bacterium]